MPFICTNPLLIQEYLQKTQQATEAISRYQAVLRKARMMRAAAEQEAEHGFDQEMQEGL